MNEKEIRLGIRNRRELVGRLMREVMSERDRTVAREKLDQINILAEEVAKLEVMLESMKHEKKNSIKEKAKAAIQNLIKKVKN